MNSEFEQIVAEAIKVEIEKAVKSAVERAKAELMTKIPELVAGMSLKVMRNVSVDRYGEEIRITVCMKGL